MPIGTPFHARTFPLCESLSYRDWSGYYAASSYEVHHEHEYSAIRHAGALIDISPLFKYLVAGRDAAALVDRIITRDVSALAVGQVAYTPWCDEFGRVIDDGTVSRVGDAVFRWTAADPSLRWLRLNGAGLDVTIDDISESVAALALQGPAAADVLRYAAEIDVDGLRYFRVAPGRIGGVAIEISRTGYTGDLGYEVWMPAAQATVVWDALMAAGRPLGLAPAGMLALDVARIEAGLLLIDVDFFSCRKALIPSQCSTPFELGLGRLVSLEKRPFVGQRALREAARRPAPKQVAGLEIDWAAVERIHDRLGLPATAPTTASRVAVPVYRSGRQVGKVTSSTWSPVLKKMLALATLAWPNAEPGGEVEVEVTVEAVRHYVPARVVTLPFFNPPRKTAQPPPTAGDAIGPAHGSGPLAVAALPGK